MLLYINENREIWAYNPTISKEDAQKHINNIDCFWIDGLEIEYPPHEENQTVETYLNKDNTIRYEIVDIPIEPKAATLDDVKQDTETLQEDNLILMGAQAEQYEEQQSIKQDMLTIMAAIAELYEMQSTGGVR